MSTPQDVALADVRKGIAMFRKVGVPVRTILHLHPHLRPRPRVAVSNLVYFILFYLISFFLVGQITGLLLNQSYFLCPSCDVRHDLFGSSDLFHATARQLGVPVLGELPLAPEVSGSGDAGAPYALLGGAGGGGGARWREGLEEVAERVWGSLG